MLGKTTIFCGLTLVAALVMLFTGCGKPQTEGPLASSSNSSAKAKPSESKTDGEHAHQAGAHGGNIVEIGRDNFHAEAVFEKGGTLKLYLLGRDEAKVMEVESQVLTAYGKLEGASEATLFRLRPLPQPDDAKGKTSQFIGKLPRELIGKKMEITIPSIKIGEERFRFGFTSAPAAHEENMPAKVANEEERKLYLTPGGKYTEADIKANGNQVASEKFKGKMASHDLKPQAGDKICPITLTKANPKFTWIVGGKEYQFCCPPCVDEFVQTAKDHPEKIKEPQDYVQE